MWRWYNVFMILLILPYYIQWHYSQAITDFFGIWKNFFVFIYNFFSIKKLVVSILAPWQKIEETYSEHFEFEGTVGTMIVNLLMRLVGAFIRIIFIIIGHISLLTCLIIGLVLFCLWIIAPLVLLYLFSKGLLLLLI